MEMRNGSYLPASIKWQNTSLSVSELAPLTRPAPARQGPSLSLSSLLCLTVHFSARIFDLERYESRRSEERGVALIHSTVSASLLCPPYPGATSSGLLPPASPLLKEVCQNIPCFFVSNISLVVSSSSRVRRRLEAMLAIYSYKTIWRDQRAPFVLIPVAE